MPSIRNAQSNPVKAIDEKLALLWLRAPEAAAHLRIGLGTLNKLRTYGGGPRYSKIGHTVIYDAADLDIWAAARKVRSTSEPLMAA